MKKSNTNDQGMQQVMYNMWKKKKINVLRFVLQLELHGVVDKTLDSQLGGPWCKSVHLGSFALQFELQRELSWQSG